MRIFTAFVTTIVTATGLLISISNTALAETEEAPLKQYDIEIIIFEDAHARYINSETWPQNDESALTLEGETTTDQTTSKVNTKVAEPDVKIENIKPAILTKEYKRINNSSEYEVLLYSAWRQQGLESSKAFDVELPALKNSHTTKSENEISGTIKVILARYLHLYGDLEYHRPIVEEVTEAYNLQNDQVTQAQQDTQWSSTTSSTNEAAEATYQIEFRRRMRSKELHYIDHPLVGILVQINPVELPKEERLLSSGNGIEATAVFCITL